MEKGEITLIAQFLSAMKDAVSKLEEAERKKDQEMLEAAKKEISQFQWQIKKIL